MNAVLSRACSVLSSGLLLLTASTTFHQAARAEVLVRAQGRCLLRSGNYEAYNGHCTFKHKQAGGTDAFVVKLDDGTDFIFRGPNPQVLQVQTYRGILNVRHKTARDHDVFIWNDGEPRYLSVKLDQAQNPNVKFEDEPGKVTSGTLAGAALGALIGGLISGNSSGTSSDPVAKAKDNCLTAVAKQTGNARGRLSVIRAQTAQSGIGVDVRVPAAQAPWFCFADSKGNVKEVRYSGSEGAL